MLIITEALIIAHLSKRKEKQPMKYDWLGRPIKRATRRQGDTARRHPVAKNKSRTTKRAKVKRAKASAKR